MGHSTLVVVVLTMLLFCAEAVVGLVTTVISLTGGTSALYASQNILDCTPAQRNLPDVNLATWCTSMLVALTYLALILHRASDIAEVVEDAQGHTHVRRLPLREVIKGSRSRMTPMLVVCLRDAAFYFLVMLGAMTLNIYFIITQHRFAQMGTAWMFATYSVATTRIFLNLKNLAARETRYSSMTLSEFGRVSGSGAVSAIEFRSMPGAIRPPHRVWYNVAGREEVYPVTRTRTVSDTPIQTYVDAR
ncbi:hypothetical protein MKEN_00289100 [Mycena kentingensis (nom. inval.)]|nr:hypothetical protein MKEN_00289100 [Mycena kentingensis (nom. inval.)]